MISPRELKIQTQLFNVFLLKKMFKKQAGLFVNTSFLIKFASYDLVSIEWHYEVVNSGIRKYKLFEIVSLLMIQPRVRIPPTPLDSQALTEM